MNNNNKMVLIIFMHKVALSVACIAGVYGEGVGGARK